MGKYGFDNLRKHSQAVRSDVSKIMDAKHEFIRLAFDNFDSYVSELQNQPVSASRNVKMMLACKLFNHVYAGMILAENGLIVDSALCGRNALETIAFYWLISVDANAIDEYLNNNIPRPVDVRKRLEKLGIDINQIKDLYARDSQATHVGRDGERFHTRWFNPSAGELFFGGAFLPNDQEEMFNYLPALLYLFQQNPSPNINT